MPKNNENIIIGSLIIDSFISEALIKFDFTNLYDKLRPVLEAMIVVLANRDIEMVCLKAQLLKQHYPKDQV